MSVVEIPDEIYQEIYLAEVCRQIDRGVFVVDARRRALEIMSHCFVSRTTSIQCDVQKDYDDQRDGDWTR